MGRCDEPEEAEAMHCKHMSHLGKGVGCGTTVVSGCLLYLYIDKTSETVADRYVHKFFKVIGISRVP